MSQSDDDSPSTPGGRSPLPTDRRLRASDFPREVMVLFNRYVHGALDRRGFLEQAGKFALAGLSASAMLDALSPRFVEAQQVKPSDPRLHTEYVEIPSPAGYGTVRGYLARPKRAHGKLPAVLVVHENRGLNPHIEDVARRVALENYVAFAPDALFPLGGYPGDEDQARTLFSQLDQTKTHEDFLAATRWLEHRHESVGVTGFCYGGEVANWLAVRVPTLAAAVPFYGRAPELPLVPEIHAALLLHFAEEDANVNALWPDYEAALKAADVPYEAHVYPGTMHGFHNDTTPRYDEAAAKLAWQRTIALFDRELRCDPRERRERRKHGRGGHGR